MPCPGRPTRTAGVRRRQGAPLCGALPKHPHLLPAGTGEIRLGTPLLDALQALQTAAASCHPLDGKCPLLSPDPFRLTRSSTPSHLQLGRQPMSSPSSASRPRRRWAAVQGARGVLLLTPTHAPSSTLPFAASPPLSNLVLRPRSPLQVEFGRVGFRPNPKLSREQPEHLVGGGCVLMGRNAGTTPVPRPTSPRLPLVLPPALALAGWPASRQDVECGGVTGRLGRSAAQVL